MIAQAILFTVLLGAAWLLGVANREDSRPGFFGLAQWLVLLVTGATAAMLLVRGVLLGAVALALVAVLAWPWTVARSWLIPRGHWRSAWFLVRSSAWAWHDDNRGGALVAAAWAALRAGGPARAVAFVERRCESSEGGAAHLLATGLIAQARGDTEAARRWIDSLVEFEGVSAPRRARQLAVQWCAAEAATRGAWTRVAEFSGDRDADATTQLLTAVARRLVQRAPVPDDAELERLWRALPQRAHWRTLVDRALEHDTDHAAEVAPAPSAPVAPERDAHATALRVHAQLLQRARVDLPAISATARAWDRVLDDHGFATRVRQRAAVLGARIDPLERLRERVDRDLLETVLAGEVALGEDSSSRSDTLGRLRRAVHQRLLDELEIVADALSTRVKARRALPIHEEWREYLTLRAAYQRAVALTGPALQRLAFAAIHGPACALAVWLWNERRNRVHAHQMFLWLLREAERAEDAEAIALQRRNVDAGR